MNNIHTGIFEPQARPTHKKRHRIRRFGTAAIVGATLVSPLAILGSAHAESVATVGAHSVFAAEGPNNTLNVWWQASPSAAYKKQVVTGAQVYSAPKVIVTATATVVVAEGPQNSLDEYTEALGSSIWTPRVIAGPGSAFSPPSIAMLPASGSDPATLAVVAEGPTNSLRAYFQPFGSFDWYFEQVAGNGTTFSIPSIAAVDNSTVVAAKGPGPTLDEYWQMNGTFAWNFELVATSGVDSAPTVAAVVSPSGGQTYIEIAVEIYPNQLWTFTQIEGAPNWSVGFVGLGDSTYSGPTIIQAGGSMVITALGPNNSLDYYYNTIGVAGWHRQEVAASGHAFSAPSIAVLAPGHGASDSIEITAQGPVLSLYEYRQVFFTAPWIATRVAGSFNAYA